MFNFRAPVTAIAIVSRFIGRFAFGELGSGPIGVGDGDGEAPGSSSRDSSGSAGLPWLQQWVTALLDLSPLGSEQRFRYHATMESSVCVNA